MQKLHADHNEFINIVKLPEKKAISVVMHKTQKKGRNYSEKYIRDEEKTKSNPPGIILETFPCFQLCATFCIQCIVSVFDSNQTDDVAV